MAESLFWMGFVIFPLPAFSSCISVSWSMRQNKVCLGGGNRTVGVFNQGRVSLSALCPAPWCSQLLCDGKLQHYGVSLAEKCSLSAFFPHINMQTIYHTLLLPYSRSIEYILMNHLKCRCMKPSIAYVCVCVCVCVYVCMCVYIYIYIYIYLFIYIHTLLGSD